jgi:ATP-dependent exoDNAse (exonuclease V) alpha subunit
MKQLLKNVGLPKEVYSKAYTIDRAIRKGVHCDHNLLTHVVIDETSMVTTSLFASFLRTFINVEWIVMVGDVNQLLPIGWGSLFSESIQCKKFAYYKLSQIHRVYHVEGEVDGIVENCNRIANAPDDVTISLVERDNFTVSIGDQDDLQEIIKSYKEGGVKDYQLAVLCPYNKRKNVEIREEINDHAQSYFRKPEKGKINYITDSCGVKWVIEDLIIMRENNYDIDVMNGETGRVVDATATHLTVSFDEEAVNNFQKGKKYQRTYQFSLDIPEDYINLTYKEKNEICNVKKDYKSSSTGFSTCFTNQVDDDDESANLHCGFLLRSYCLTIHKSQGSEWDFVILYLPPESKASPFFLHKKLFYTAVSRAKRAVFIVCDDREMLDNIINTNPAKRHELLSYRLELNVKKSEYGFDRSNLLLGTIPEDQIDAFQEYYKIYEENDDDDDYYED